MEAADFFHTDQQKRILEMDSLFRTKGGVTRRHVCDSLKRKGYSCSRYTFMNDLEHLELDLQAPIGREERPCPEIQGKLAVYYFYKDHSWTLKKFSLTEGTLLALFVGKQMVERYAGHPLADELSRAYDKLAESLNQKLTIHSEYLAAIKFHPEQAPDINIDIWKPVLRATVEQKALVMTYRSAWGANAGKPKERTVHPYHIVNLQGTWYIIASRSWTDMSVRQYSISGIQRAEVLDQRSSIPDDFDIDAILDSTFGRFTGDPKQTVEITLRFAAEAVPLAQKVNHGNREHKKRLPDGQLEVTFPASTDGPWRLYHVRQYVLSWGPQCKVIGPPMLCDLVCNDLQEALKQYDSPDNADSDL
jgi:predicted DNA-binding transcriptional regulator YafY